VIVVVFARDNQMGFCAQPCGMIEPFSVFTQTQAFLSGRSRGRVLQTNPLFSSKHSQLMKQIKQILTTHLLKGKVSSA
jgi:hypothetical protein